MSPRPLIECVHTTDHVVPLVTLAITVGGWIVTHFFSLRAQRKNLRLQALDRARHEVVDAVREAQVWIQSVVTAVTSADGALDYEPAGFFPDWLSRSQSLRSLTSAAPVAWLFRLEEYEILFPNTATVRERLAGRQRNIVENMRQLASILGLQPTPFGSPPTDASNEKREARERAREWVSDVYDQGYLLEDLILELQNAALHEISGRRIPGRIPRDPKLPRIKADKDGTLWIEPDRPEPLVLHVDSKPGKGT